MIQPAAASRSRARLSPLARPLADQLIRLIQTGSLSAGQKLPTVRELARRHSVSYRVAHDVVCHLERNGFVESLRGSGTYVAERRTARGPRRNSRTRPHVFVLSNDTERTFGALVLPIVNTLQESAIMVTPLSYGPDACRLDELSGIFERWTKEPPLAVIIKGGVPLTTSAVDRHLPACTCRIVAYSGANDAPPDWHVIGSDESKGHYLAAQHLLAKGHRRLGLVTTHRKFAGRRKPPRRRDRHILGILGAYADAKLPRGLSVHWNPKSASDPTGLGEDQANLNRLARWMRGPDAPTAFIAAQHRAPCIEYAAELAGLRLGRDIDLVTYGDRTPALHGEHACVWERQDLVAAHINQIVLEHRPGSDRVIKRLFVQPELVEPKLRADLSYTTSTIVASG